jgi:hypothetical protein
MSREAEAIPQYHRALRLDRKHPNRYEIFLYLASSYRKTARPAAGRRWLNRADATGRRSRLAEKLHRLLDRKRAL